jgi:hypothetical protein
MPLTGESRKIEAAKGGAEAHRRGHAHVFTAEERARGAALGGQTAHQRGKAHEWTPEAARAAGRLGGLARRREPREGARDTAKFVPGPPGGNVNNPQVGNVFVVGRMARQIVRVAEKIGYTQRRIGTIDGGRLRLVYERTLEAWRADVG